MNKRVCNRMTSINLILADCQTIMVEINMKQSDKFTTLYCRLTFDDDFQDNKFDSVPLMGVSKPSF